MKKITLQTDQKQGFLDYTRERISKSTKNYNHLTTSILTKTYDYFVDHSLTAQENGATYWKHNNKKQIESYGYSGYSKNDIDDFEAMEENLYHEVFCKAEWIARSRIENFADICKGYLGHKAYNSITA